MKFFYELQWDSWFTPALQYQRTTDEFYGFVGLVVGPIQVGIRWGTDDNDPWPQYA